MNLDPKERLIFHNWCKQQADSCNTIADQIDKLSGVTDILSKRERQKAMAFAIVMRELMFVHDQVEIKPEDVGNI